MFANYISILEQGPLVIFLLIRYDLLHARMPGLFDNLVVFIQCLMQQYLCQTFALAEIKVNVSVKFNVNQYYWQRHPL